MSDQGAPSPAKKPPLVLLVEDDLDIRDALQDALEVEGFEVVPAGSGKQALDYLKDGQTPDLVLLDLMMPIVTGWQVMDVMRRTPTLAAVPTVVMTAVERDRPSGARAVLRKPFELDDLLAVARDVLSTGSSPGRAPV